MLSKGEIVMKTTISDVTTQYPMPHKSMTNHSQSKLSRIKYLLNELLNDHHCQTCTKKLISDKSGVPSFDRLLDAISNYSAEFYEKINKLEAKVDPVVAGDEVALVSFQQILDELKLKLSHLDQEAISTKSELDNYRKKIEDEIRKRGEAAGMPPSWEHHIEGMKETMRDFMAYASAEEWAEYKISICRNDPNTSMQPLILQSVVIENKHQYALNGGKELAVISNNLVSIQETLAEINSSSGIILKLKIRATKDNWISLNSFIDDINHKKHLLEDCSD